MLVNDTIICGSSIPHTLFSDNSFEQGADVGTQFFINLREGWNKVEFLFSLVDSSSYYQDNTEVGDPYLQLIVYPSLFDTNIKFEYGIDMIVASPSVRAVTEFDLLWNLSKSIENWAWDSTNTNILFNASQSEIQSVDGYLKGTLPSCQLTYQTGDTSLVGSEVYVRVDLSRDDLSKNTAIVRDYSVMVR
jgi:hypothetical protein